MEPRISRIQLWLVISQTYSSRGSVSRLSLEQVVPIGLLLSSISRILMLLLRGMRLRFGFLPCVLQSTDHSHIVSVYNSIVSLVRLRLSVLSLSVLVWLSRRVIYLRVFHSFLLYIVLEVSGEIQILSSWAPTLEDRPSERAMEYMRLHSQTMPKYGHLILVSWTSFHIRNLWARLNISRVFSKISNNPTHTYCSGEIGVLILRVKMESSPTDDDGYSHCFHSQLETVAIGLLTSGWWAGWLHLVKKSLDFQENMHSSFSDISDRRANRATSSYGIPTQVDMYIRMLSGCGSGHWCSIVHSLFHNKK